MPTRHLSRQRAVQILYQVDLRKLSVEEAIQQFYTSLYSGENENDQESPRPERDVFMEELSHGTLARQAELDQVIGQRSENWRLERMPIVDRNILRMAVFEMAHLGTPPPVVIDQALELARRFSGEESVPFINGVLDAVYQQRKQP